MSLSLQKASFLKRISAYILDFILVLMLTTGAALAVSAIVNYDACFDAYQTRRESFYVKIEEKYEIDHRLSTEEYEALSAEDRAAYNATQKIALSELDELLQADQEFMALQSKIFTYVLLITSIGILFGVFGTYFVIPLFFKNGQCINGKNITDINRLFCQQFQSCKAETTHTESQV